MKRAIRFWLTGICAISCLLGAMHWFHTRPIYAQQDTGDSDDGNIYVYASVDVDSNYYLYADSYTELDFDADCDIDLVGDEIQVDEDQDIFFDDDADADPSFSEYPPLESNNPVATGHEYGVGSIGWVCIDDGEGGCDWYPENYAYASVYVSAPSPQITSISPSSVTQGAQGTLTITGSNLVENSGDQLTINLAGSSAPFTLAGAPSASTASFTYNFAGYPAGSYTLSVTNNEGTSNSETFTVAAAPQNPPADPCAVTSNPQAGYTSIVSTGTAGGSGTLAVSFSGTAFAALSPTVTYGPNSTPSSIAANIAALITRNYYRYGLSAKAFGPNIVYSGLTTLGTVSNVATGSSFTTSNSSTLASATETSCQTATEGKPTVEINNHQAGESYTIYVGGTLPLSATGTPAGGTFSWTSSSSAVSISPTNQAAVTLTGNSAGTTSIHVNYSVNQIAADPDGAIVHVLTPAYVTNFQQSSVTSANGNLIFTYTWSSSTGNLSDLSGCSVGESVTYDSNAWPSPPYASGAPPNPTVNSVPGPRGQLTDNQENPGFVTPYAASNFNATQKFRFMCPNYQGGNFVDLQTGIVINRTVSQVSSSAWKYTVTKSGQSAQINPLP